MAQNSSNMTYDFKLYANDAIRHAKIRAYRVVVQVKFICQ